jgi:anaerobic magnesium-protoporphyrin IX monomethyl ester cyclase
LESDPVERVLSEIEGAVCLGVSTVTGPSIIEGLKVSSEVKRAYPEIPIVWGGAHPTILPDQTVAHPAVDIVVRGQGEITMWELVKALASGRDLREVRGVTYKHGGRAFSTPRPPMTDINDLPPVSYSLIDVEKYLEVYSDLAGLKYIEGRKPKAISYLSSTGCPFNCRFCSDRVMSGGKWFALKAERVVAEITVLAEKYGVELVVLADNNFFVSPSRVKKICKLMEERNVEVLWAAGSRSDVLSRFSDSEVEMLYHCGCRLVLVGAESGSQKTLDLLDKRTRPEDTDIATRRFTAHGIAINLDYMFGLPDEPQDSPWETSRQVHRLAAGNDRVTLSYFFYTPYPGTQLFDRAVELGFEPPQSLQAWAKITFRSMDFHATNEALLRRLDLLRLMFMSKLKPGIRNLPRNLVVMLLKISARIRLRLRTFALPLDLFVMNLVARRKPRRRPPTPAI